MPKEPLCQTKTAKIKRKTSLFLPQKLVFFHVKYPNGCIQTEQLQGRDCVCYKAVIIPDVKTPTRFFTGHCIAGLNSLYSIHKPSVIKRAENSAVDRAFHFMGVGLTDRISDHIIKKTKEGLKDQCDLKSVKTTVCPECGRVWKRDIDGKRGILGICPECEIKKRIFSRVKIV